MSGRRGAVRGKAGRAICPECGRDIAAMWNADMTRLRMTSTYLLAPHNIAPGKRCRGWMIGKDNLVQKPSEWAEHTHPDPYCAINCSPGHKHSQCGCTCDHRSENPS